MQKVSFLSKKRHFYQKNVIFEHFLSFLVKKPSFWGQKPSIGVSGIAKKWKKTGGFIGKKREKLKIVLKGWQKRPFWGVLGVFFDPFPYKTACLGQKRGPKLTFFDVFGKKRVIFIDFLTFFDVFWRFLTFFRVFWRFFTKPRIFRLKGKSGKIR